MVAMRIFCPLKVFVLDSELAQFLQPFNCFPELEKGGSASFCEVLEILWGLEPWSFSPCHLGDVPCSADLCYVLVLCHALF